MPLPTAGKLFGFYYPNAMAGAGISFEPHIGPVPGTKIHEDDGVLADLAGDNTTLYVYSIAVPKEIYELHFSFLNEADRTLWKAFRAIAGLQLFDMLDPVSGTTFQVGIWEFERDFTVDEPFDERLGATITVYRPEA